MTSSPEGKKNEANPSLSLTPPPVTRNPNKYNSTIVEVNEETPNESSNSELGDVEFLVEEYETGSRYEGFKKAGLRHGKGKFFYQDGGYYDGEWKCNQMHGWGKLYYEGGQLAYEGNWAHDEFHGYGKVYNDNPVPLDAKFDYTNFDLLDDYWEFYEGMLANDTKEGRGKIQLTNKEVFEGDFHADRIQGFGKFHKKDGSTVEGIWKDSRLIKVLNFADIYK
jgi:hypothetical protein